MDTVIAWSGGKDSAYALHKAQQETDLTPTALVTTVSAVHDRVSIHGVSTTLLEAQAAAIGLPLRTVPLPPDCSMAQYRNRWTATLEQDCDADAIVFADIVRDDIRSRREQYLDGTSMTGRWPLWGQDTEQVVDDVLAAGFKATIVCADGDVHDGAMVGQPFTRSFVDRLPSTVDPCGEDGTFHTFVWDGPIFDTSLPVRPGATRERTVANDTTHRYCELHLETEP